jgi:hypothetical protein
MDRSFSWFGLCLVLGCAGDSAGSGESVDRDRDTGRPDLGLDRDSGSRDSGVDPGRDDASEDAEADVGAPEDADAPGPGDAGDDAAGDDSSSDPVDVADVEDAALADTSADGGVDTNGPVCVSVDATARELVRPVDAIWVVDNSLSMQEEVVQVSRNLNAFSAAVGEAGVDIRVVMIANDDPTVGDGMYHVCVPPPLAGPTTEGTCPTGRDSDSERYLHVRRFVDSERPMADLLASYPAWSGFLRPGSARHIVFVTDDTSTLTDAEFESQLARLSPAFGREYVVHAIVARDSSELADPWDDNPRPGDPCADEVGQPFVDAARRTGGVVESVCALDWSATFAAISASAVSSTHVPCAYALPEPPADAALDLERVNVVATTDGSESVVANVAGAEACVEGPGWYWSPAVAPTSLMLCPATCAAETGADALSVELGCVTVKR